MCEAVAKSPPERRTEISLRIAVEPLQAGRRVAAPFLFCKRCCGEFHVRNVAADFNFQNSLTRKRRFRQASRTEPRRSVHANQRSYGRLFRQTPVQLTP